GYAERRFRPRVAAEGEEVSLSDADAYDRFMGRYSRPLAVPFADFAGLPLDGRVLDVGCGPGALTAELARRARPGRVTAVDPSEEFVAALRGRHPEVQVIRAPAEDLPFEGGCFDATLAQLVVNVMDDPVAGLREMARVTRDGGVVAACVWDFTDGGPIGPFWDAAQALDPEVETGSVCPGSRAGHLADLFRAAGIGDIVDSAVAVDVEHATGEGEEPQPDAGAQARECAGAVALEAELSLAGPKDRFDPLAHAPERSELERLVLAIGTKELGSAIGHPALELGAGEPLVGDDGE